MSLLLLFSWRPCDVGGGIPYRTLNARWLANEKKDELIRLKSPKKLNRKIKRKIEAKKKELVQEVLAAKAEEKALPLPSLLPDINALLDAYELLDSQLALQQQTQSYYSEQARAHAEAEKQRLLAIKAAIEQEEEDLLLALLLTL